MRRFSRRSCCGRASRASQLIADVFVGLCGSLVSLPARSASPVPVPTSALPALELPQPQILKSTNGVLDTTLTATPAVVEMRAASPVTTYTYDGLVPGRTWEVKAGDTLRFDVINELPPLPGHAEPDLTRPHEWTTTNIHTHGMHVAPGDKRWSR